jgi:hypothetical protein
MRTLELTELTGVSGGGKIWEATKTAAGPVLTGAMALGGVDSAISAGKAEYAKSGSLPRAVSAGAGDALSYATSWAASYNPYTLGAFLTMRSTPAY